MKLPKTIYSIKVNESFDFGKVTTESYLKLEKKFSDIDFIELTPLKDVLGKDSYDVDMFVKPVSIVDEDKILKLSINNINFTVTETINLNLDITKQLIEFAGKPIKVVQESVGDTYYNNKCEVHMPGMAMSLYNEVLLLEDACTDELQLKLASGWRIISACPQPDQRRPDYILGRFNPNYDGDTNAAR